MLKRTLILVLMAALLHGCAHTPKGTRLTLMSFNMWGGGLNEGKPIDETMAVLRAVDADLIGLQETRAEGDPCTERVCRPAGESVAPAIAEALGFFYFEQPQETGATWADAILSRYPILAVTPNGLGVLVEVDGRRVHVFNLWLSDFPYQPYQLTGIPYGPAPWLDNAGDAVAAARAARGKGLALFREDLAQAGGSEVQVIFGDFNEPSHRDWSERAAAAGRHPLAVPFPTVRALEDMGFVDALRAVYPDEMTHPAFTWTPRAAPDERDEHHDRIDYVLVRGAGVAVESAAIVGEEPGAAGIVVTPFPSDHRAVTATIRVGRVE